MLRPAQLRALLLSVVVASGAHAARRQKAGRLTGELVSIRECKESADIVRSSPNVTSVTFPDGTFTTSTSFDLLKGTKTVPKGTIRFEFCLQGVGRNCETQSNWKFKDGCEMWTNKLTLWNKFHEAIHPPFVCPYTPGHYTVTNLTLDVKRLEMLPLPIENRDWLVTIKTYGDNEEPWVCFVVVARFFRMGRRRNKA